MGNVARLDDYRAQDTSEVRRVANTDEGYTRLANELYEELIGANLTRNQAKVAHAICRKTYGYNKKMDRISDSQLATLTKLPRQKVNKAKNQLIDMGVVISDGRMIGPNKDLSQWNLPECNQFSDNDTKTVTKSVTKSVTALSPKQGHTKDNITKDKKDNINISSNEDISPSTLKKSSYEELIPVATEEKKSKLKCEDVIAVYHEVLPEARKIKALNDKRRNLIRTFWIKASKITRQLDGKPFTLEDWRAYLEYIASNCRWTLEDRPDNKTGKTWRRKGLEYFLNDEVYLQVREGAKDDI